MRWGVLFLVVGCKHEAAPTPPAPLASVVPTPAAAAVPSAELGSFVVDLLFRKGQLYSCDELSGPADKMHEIAQKLNVELAKSKLNDEVVVEGKTCHEATSGRIWQAVCKLPKISTAYYDAKSLKGSDEHMRECLSKDGTWKVNDSSEANADALQREIASPEHQELRKRALQALGAEN